MSIYIDKNRIIDETDWQNTNAGTNLVKGPVLDSEGKIQQDGNYRDYTWSTDRTNNYSFYVFPLNVSFKKGDLFTISADATLTGDQAGEGLYKMTIYNSNTSKCYDPAEDSIPLKAGQRSSKTIKVTADSNPQFPPVLLIYAGVAGRTGGNTIHIQNVKVERGSIATQWSPAPEDLVLKSEFDSLKEKVDSLTKSINGGVKPSYRLCVTSLKEVA